MSRLQPWARRLGTASAVLALVVLLFSAMYLAADAEGFGGCRIGAVADREVALQGVDDAAVDLIEDRGFGSRHTWRRSA